MTMSTTIGSSTAINEGFFEQMATLPSGISEAGRVPSAAQAPGIVADGDAGTLAALETALSLSVYRWKFLKSDGVTPIYLVFFT